MQELKESETYHRVCVSLRPPSVLDQLGKYLMLQIEKQKLLCSAQIARLQ
jgi:hypothetical protein